MIDVNLRGVLYGIAAALPVFRVQGFGHFVNTSSTAAHRIVLNQSVYAATKTAVNVISESLRQEAGDKLRVTVITPGFTKTDSRTTSPTRGLELRSAKARTGSRCHPMQSPAPSHTRSSSRPASTSARSSSAPPRKDDSAQGGELAGRGLQSGQRLGSKTLSSWTPAGCACQIGADQLAIAYGPRSAASVTFGS